MAAMGEALTAADKHVVTHGVQSLDWANSHRLAGIAAVLQLKESDGPDLLIQDHPHSTLPCSLRG